MEFKELIEKRRSIRKFSERAVPREIVDRILHETLSAPSARNTRTTRLVVVDDPALVARMADMRDYGSAFMKGAPLAIVVLGDTTKSDLWRENAAISATILQLACVDEGLASCWVHIDGRPRRKDEPGGETAAGYLQLPAHPGGLPTPLRRCGGVFRLYPRPAARVGRRCADHPPGVRTDTGTDEKGSSRRGFLFPFKSASCACEACRVPVF